MRVSKWGNSLAIRLPAAVVDALDLKEGDDVRVHLADDRNLGIEKQAGREELVARLEKLLKGRLPADFTFDRDEANAR